MEWAVTLKMCKGELAAADELVTGEGVNILCGTFLSNVGLAVTEFAGKKKVFFLGAEALTDKMVWQNGNRYTFRLRASTYMQVAMLMPSLITDIPQPAAARRRLRFRGRARGRRAPVPW